MNVLDLFSGIGGFSLGLERAGMRTVAFCECEPYARAVLAKHWPDVPCYPDVRELSADRLAADGISVDVICGGFPCQDISEAGKGAGLVGTRSGLWREYRRLLSEVRPQFAIIENVSALRTRGLAEILGDLAILGLDAEWSVVPACSVGAPHPRDRLFILAYASGRRREQRRGVELEACRYQKGDVHHWQDQPEPPRVADGVPFRVDRNRALGNAVVPQIPEIIGRAIMRHAHGK